MAQPQATLEKKAVGQELKVVVAVVIEFTNIGKHIALLKGRDYCLMCVCVCPRAYLWNG